MNYSKLNELPQVTNNSGGVTKDDVIIKTVKRLFTRNGVFPAHLKNLFIGQELRVKLSSMAIGQVINVLNNQSVEMATIDVVDENGKLIDWEFIDIIMD